MASEIELTGEQVTQIAEALVKIWTGNKTKETK